MRPNQSRFSSNSSNEAPCCYKPRLPSVLASFLAMIPESRWHEGQRRGSKQATCLTKLLQRPTHFSETTSIRPQKIPTFSVPFRRSVDAQTFRSDPRPLFRVHWQQNWLPIGHTGKERVSLRLGNHHALKNVTLKRLCWVGLEWVTTT